MQDFDPRDLRNAFGSFATGVTVVTSAHGGRDAGLTANSFSSVSLDPPLILWSLDRKSANLALFEAGEGFAVHVLAADQEELSNRFAGKSPDRFADLAFTRGIAGTPLLGGCAARFECRKAYTYDGGDHVIFVGEVLDYQHSARPPLLFHGGQYKRAHRPAPGDENPISLVTNIARLYLFIREEAIELARSKGLSWPDVTVLGVIARSGPIAREAISTRIAPACLLLDDGMIARLAGAGLVVWQDGLLAATEDGDHFATRLAAAARAREMELKLQAGEAFEQLSVIMAAFAEAYGVDPVQTDPVDELAGNLG